MKSIIQRTIIFTVSSRSLLFAKPQSHHHTLLQISKFLTSNGFHSSPTNSSYTSRRQEEESRNIKVSVWWDFENCGLPAGVNVFRLAQSIMSAIRANGIKGPIQITAFGNVMQLSKANQEALSSTGINLTHIPGGAKNSADRFLLVDLMYWISQNPPPAHLFLISGDKDFAGILHRLRMNNYNILLASPQKAPGVLCSAASIVWQWNALVRGENIRGKYFNHPPDGPYRSWYGHYSEPLEDPFPVNEQPTCLQAEESSEPGPEPKLRPIPNAVVKQIRCILDLNPKGIPVTQLRFQLARSGAIKDKDLYGYKTFSHFLLAMPDVLKVHHENDGHLLVQSVVQKGPEQLESGSVIEEDSDFPGTSKLNGDGSYSRIVEEYSSLPDELSLKDSSESLQVYATEKQEPKRTVQEPSAAAEVISHAKPTEFRLQHVVEQDSASEVGYFKRIWRKLLFGKDGSLENKGCSQLEKCSTDKLNVQLEQSLENKGLLKTQLVGFPTSASSSSSACADMVADGTVAVSSESEGNKCSSAPGILRQIMEWCKFWKNSTGLGNSGKKPSDVQLKSESKRHEMFFKESFWNDMNVFLDTPKCSDVILQSSSREQMAQNLQKMGPLVLRSLDENELLDLVDLLISDKKWVKECSTQTFPFKLTRPAVRSSSSCHGSNSLRSIFLSNQAKPTLKSPPEHNGVEKHQNLPNTVIPESVIQKRQSDESRTEILANCQKLVDYITKEYSEGCNLGCFRKLFFEKYGYPLDVRSLGYKKLANLLQVMAGARIEGNYIVPDSALENSRLETVESNVQGRSVNSTTANSDRELSDSLKKEDDIESPYDELGPVTHTGSKRNVMELELSRKVNGGGEKPKNNDYEYELDDLFSDSVEEALSTKGLKNQTKPGIPEEDSSLLRILDSWHNNKEGDDRRDVSENVNELVDCSRLASSGVDVKSVCNRPYYAWKQRPSKRYSFVPDQSVDDGDKLINGILSSLKKSGGKSAESKI